MNDMTVQQTPSTLIEEYIRLRDEKNKLTAEFDEACRLTFNEPMAMIEKNILALLNGMGVNSISSDTTTAYKNTMRSVTIEDKPSFRRHVIGTEAWDMIDWRANKTLIGDMVSSGEDLPPGIKYVETIKVGFRKKS